LLQVFGFADEATFATPTRQRLITKVFEYLRRLLRLLKLRFSLFGFLDNLFFEPLVFANPNTKPT
jgi:hypothetical protein